MLYSTWPTRRSDGVAPGDAVSDDGIQAGLILLVTAPGQQRPTHTHTHTYTEPEAERQREREIDRATNTTRVGGTRRRNSSVSDEITRRLQRPTSTPAERTNRPSADVRRALKQSPIHIRLLGIASSQQRSSSTRLNEHRCSARESAVVEHGREASAALGRSSSVANRQTDRPSSPIY